MTSIRPTMLLLVMALAIAADPASAQQKIRVLIITGSQQVHDWYNTTPILKQALESTGKFQVDVTENPPQAAGRGGRGGAPGAGGPAAAPGGTVPTGGR